MLEQTPEPFFLGNLPFPGHRKTLSPKLARRTLQTWLPLTKTLRLWTVTHFPHEILKCMSLRGNKHTFPKTANSPRPQRTWILLPWGCDRPLPQLTPSPKPQGSQLTECHFRSWAARSGATQGTRCHSGSRGTCVIGSCTRSESQEISLRSQVRKPEGQAAHGVTEQAELTLQEIKQRFRSRESWVRKPKAQSEQSQRMSSVK